MPSSRTPASPISGRLRRISSRQNTLLKEMRRAFAQAEPTPDGFCAIEGVKLIEEAIRSGLKLRTVVFSGSGASQAGRLLPQLKAQVETILVDDDVFRGAVSTDSPQGVAALVQLLEHSLTDLLKPKAPFLVVAAGLQDPGNLGAIQRSAEAFGATGMVLGENTVSRFNAKAIRASAGSAFRLPCAAANTQDILCQLRSHSVRLVGTSSHKGTPLPEAGLRGPIALFIGNEGTGLSGELLHEMDELVSIPHASKVESLNASIAASVILYEAFRQRVAGS